MKIKKRLFITLLCLNLILLLMVIFLFKERNVCFLIAEIGFVISVTLSVLIFRRIAKYMNLISVETEFIKENDFNTKFVSLKNNELNSMVQVYNEMIDKLRRERLLQKEQFHFLDKIIKASPSGIILMDLDQKIISMNPMAEQITGLRVDEVIGRRTDEVRNTIFRGISNMDKKDSILAISGIKTIRCQKSHFIDRSYVRYFIFLEEISNVTIDSEKKAYEKVIRMMSHEVNNSIGPINSILESSLYYGKYLREDDRKEFENVVAVAINRNKHLNQFTSNFADVVKIPSPNRSYCNLNELLLNQKPLFESINASFIKVVWELCETDLIVFIDEGQIEQVLHNIFKNAVEAINSNGIISIKTFDNPIRLIISDNGRGIPEHLKSQLFSPFFSTKKNGQGIGLMLVREILRNHRLKFSLETNKENVTEFIIKM